MSVLESIRKRAGLLVLLIGASMVIFVLEDALTSGRFFFGGGNENTVATVNGKKLNYQDLNNKVEEMLSIEKTAKGTEALDNGTYNNTVQGAYEEMVNKMLLGPQMKMLGIAVTDSELTDLMLGKHPAPEIVEAFTDPNTGQIYKGLQDPRTGGLDMNKVVLYVKQMKTEQELAMWTLRENEIREHQLSNKYFDLLRNGLFVTDAEAKQETEDATKFYNISYVLQKYSSLPDNSVTLTDQDMQSWYNRHLYEFNQDEKTTKVDYVTFRADPTPRDMSDLQKDVDSIASAFRKLKAGDDSIFIVDKSDNHSFDKKYYKHSDLPQSIDSIMCSSAPGFVYGPYKENNEYRIAKLIGVEEMPDSVKVAHIIFPADKGGDFSKAKIMADSIKKIITPDNFASLAHQYSQDQESAQKGGDLGWFTQGKLLPEMDKACFAANKGDILEIKSPYGYHLIYVEDENDKSKHYQVGVIVKKIGPSRETTDSVFSLASSFSGKHPSTEMFEKAAGDMNKRVADLKENDEKVPGIDNPKELIRWAFQAKQGDVSGVFDGGNNLYIVAHLEQITPRGTAPFDQVKDEVRPLALQELKAQKLIASMKSAAQGASGIEAVAQKLGVQPQTAMHISFDTHTVPGLGIEDALLGVMSGIKPQTLSEPFKGESGVFIIRVDSLSASPSALDFRYVQAQQQDVIRRRVEYDAYDALAKNAGLVSHLGKFY